MVTQRLAVPSMAVAIALPASAGLVPTGVFTGRTDRAAAASARRAVFASGYASFGALLGPTSASLVWQPSLASFAGAYPGTALLDARSRGPGVDRGISRGDS